MPQHTPEDQRDFNTLRVKIDEILNTQIDQLRTNDPLSRAISRRMQEDGQLFPMPESDTGFFRRLGDVLTPQTPEEFGLIGAGLIVPTIQGLQAIAQIPGLFTARDIPTDRAADFLERLGSGITNRAESAALAAGVSPDLIADSHLLGEIIGYTVPVVAALKAARLITKIQGPVIGIGRNLLLDTTAGAIFGATLRPEEELLKRVEATLKESAIFGVGGLLINGLVFGVLGFRFGRALAHAGDDSLDDVLRRIQSGERIVLQDSEVGPLVQLMNEEGFLANSLEAQRLLANLEFENSLVAGVRGAAEAGQSRGIVQDIGRNFTEVSAHVERMRIEFPNLKFDIVGRDTAVMIGREMAEGVVGTGRTFDLHFGLKGLSNLQKAQLKKEGLFLGQIIQKNGTTYEYIRPGRKAETIMVLTADKQVTSIQRRGVTILPYAVEEIPLPTAGQALYSDFREFVFNRMGAAAGLEGGLTERSIIRGLRDGTLSLTDDAERLFDIGGAITHPSELNLQFARLGNPQAAQAAVGQEGVAAIIDTQGMMWLAPPGGQHLEAVTEMIMARLKLTREQAAEAFQLAQPGDQISQLIEGVTRGNFTASTRTFASSVEGEAGQALVFASGAEEFSANFIRGGKITGDMLEPIGIRNMDDVFNAWAENRGLALDSSDIEAFRQNFATRFRDDLWAMVPDEEMSIFRAIRNEINEMIDENPLTLAQRAATKGFHVDELEGGRIALRDINTNARVPEFGSERRASDFIDSVIRAEKDPLGMFLSPGAHGMPALHGGFGVTDGVFTLEGNILAKDFLDDIAFASTQNRRDYLISVEKVTGMPLFSQGFGLIDQAMTRKQELLEPIGKRIQATWKRVSRKDRIAVADFWGTVVGRDLSTSELLAASRTAGLSNRQFRAFRESRDLFKLGDELMGFTEASFIDTYYASIRPGLTRGETIGQIGAQLADDPAAQQGLKFWEQYYRSGDLSNLELDPEIILHKYFRTLFYSQEVAPLERQFRSMLDMRIKQLPRAKQMEILRNSSLPNTTGESFVLPDAIRSVGQEYLVNIRGDGSPGFATMREVTRRTFKRLGMETDDKLFDELHSTYLSLQYGAAIGLRFSLLNRNAVQNLWMMYTRVGGKHGTTSLRRAMTQEGYDEAVASGAIRPIQQSVAQGDAIYEQFWASKPITGTNPASMAMASGLRHAVRLGRISRKASQKSLIPYGSSDQVNRAWAFHWQKIHTAEKLADFDAGRIDWDKFLDDGLPFFSTVIKDDFRTRFDKLGREAALNFIGKQAADEAHFIYGAASSPTWMQRPFGRLLGVFGQWPLWAYELYMRRTAHATPAQLGAFWARSLALMGVFTNMTVQSGINMWNWMAPVSLEYAGGPFTDVLVDLKNIVDAPLDRKVSSMNRLFKNVGSLALPGQIFYSEFSAAMDERNPLQGALMLGLGRPVDVSNFAYDWVVNPDAIFPDPVVQPEQLLNLQPIDELLER